MLNPSKLREDTLGLTLEHEIQRCRLQDLVILKEPLRDCPMVDVGGLPSLLVSGCWFIVRHPPADKPP